MSFRSGSRIRCVDATNSDGALRKNQKYIVGERQDSPWRYEEMVHIKTLKGLDMGEWYTSRFVTDQPLNKNTKTI